MDRKWYDIKVKDPLESPQGLFAVFGGSFQVGCRSDEERMFMYRINKSHLGVICIVTIWPGGPRSLVRIIAQIQYKDLKKLQRTIGIFPRCLSLGHHWWSTVYDPPAFCSIWHFVYIDRFNEALLADKRAIRNPRDLSRLSLGLSL